MLDQRFGGLRPWEMDSLTPREEQLIHARRNQILTAEEGV